MIGTENCDDGPGGPTNCVAGCKSGPLPTHICLSGSPTQASICFICGNGNLETGENCDDNNSNLGDGCSPTC